MDISTAASAAPLAAATTMMVCPTSHNDWDWEQTFGGYYTCSSNDFGVQGILESVAAILESNNTDFRFSYAEVAFLRQYLNDSADPTRVDIFREKPQQFCLLGGGITSPDNQVAHSEVFIRNYLTGHAYLGSKGLMDNIFPVVWVPDDFGHSPQLPVLAEALGMKAIALSRIPGSPQPPLCPAQQPAAADVRGNGTSFYWAVQDGSRVLTHFMPNTYYGVSNFDRNDAHAGMTEFLGNCTDCVWPGGTVFATDGGDWQFPNSSIPGGGSSENWYNWTGVPGPVNPSLTGQLATFAEYYETLMEDPTVINNFTLFAENYYTGYFASRPQLKIDHYEAAQLLLGTEVLASILLIYNGTTPAMQAVLQAKIDNGWELLVPTTHHDFVAGTTCDKVYYHGGSCGNQDCPTANPSVGWDSNGQLSMSNQTVALARDAMDTAMDQLSIVAGWPTTPNMVPVVVFNQLGRDLPETAIVEIDDPTHGTVDYEVIVDGVVGVVQRSWDGKLLFQVPNMLSMSTKVVGLLPLGRSPTPPFPPQSISNSTFLFENGAVNLTLARDFGWAIMNLTIGNRSYVQPGAPANRIGVWQDDGNIYQFGMEFISSGGCTTGTFAIHSFLNATGPGKLVENGPIRWRFNATLNDTFGNLYETQYDLVRGETLVHINTTGAAPQTSGGWSVMASFPMQTADKETATALEYGTSYFWEDREPQTSWEGPTFRASHDFAQLVTQQGGTAVAAVYHNGIPAWTINGTTLHGVLLRNTPYGQRAVGGSDNGTHSQHYTLDVQSQLANTGYPLRTALYAQTPLRAVPLDLTRHVSQIPGTAQLAGVLPSDVVLAVGKTTQGSLVLRIQRSNPVDQEIEITLPWRHSTVPIEPRPSIVSALETPIDSAPPVTTSGASNLFQANRVLMTMEVPLE
ncbi:glycosyl hydrolases family 38 N-terminal domain-containing protein [Mycena capillaripes]|nr:glycosyl hydrolases family 38 N-terminal domain-containing protein [Mycena capillaripes]